MTAALVIVGLVALGATLVALISLASAASCRADSAALLSQLAETEAALIRLRAREVGAHAAEAAAEMDAEELAARLNVELSKPVEHLPDNPGGGS